MHLGGLVARNKRTVPREEGVIYQEKRYTWAEVDDRVNTVANALVKAGPQFVLCMTQSRIAFCTSPRFSTPPNSTCTSTPARTWGVPTSS